MAHVALRKISAKVPGGIAIHLLGSSLHRSVCTFNIGPEKLAVEIDLARAVDAGVVGGAQGIYLGRGGELGEAVQKGGMGCREIAGVIASLA